MYFRNFALRALSAEHLNALLPAMQEVTVPAGHIIHARGEPVDAVFFPNTAVLSIVTKMADGRRVESATVGLESAVGILPMLSTQAASSEIVAQVSGAATKIEAQALRARALAYPKLLELLLRFAQANMVQAEQSAACNALHAVDARLAKWLLETYDRVGGETIALTQEYLSVMVGVQRTTVSAAAAGFQTEGLIRYSRGKIEILDEPALKLRACECYTRSREAFARLAAEPDAQTSAA